MWYFVAPQIVFGECALDRLSELRGRQALIVTDATLVKLGLARKVEMRLVKAGLAVETFDAVEPDPSLETVFKGAEMARRYEPDWIIGLGGGSSIDAAKAIWVQYERPDLTPVEINPFIDLDLRRKARFIAIPTTSGTGSEATCAVVLTDTAERRKVSLINREMIADIAIIDPEMACGMPPRLTADTGLDALTHAVEGYTCTWHNDMTDGICIHAVKLIFGYLPRAVADGNDLVARTKMHNAATLAGLGFGNSLASLAHAMGHSLGAVFHVPHGRAVGIFLPCTVEFMARDAPQRFAELASAAIGLDSEIDLARALALAGRIRHLCIEVGSPTSVSELGIGRNTYEQHLDELVAKSFNDGTILTAVRSPSFDELRQLFVCAYDARTIDF